MEIFFRELLRPFYTAVVRVILAVVILRLWLWASQLKRALGDKWVEYRGNHTGQSRLRR